MAKKTAEAPSPWIGKKAPTFALSDQEGRTHTLAGFKGRWLVIFWYPKDQTEGCSAEACGFRDNASAYRDQGVSVLGISILNVKSKAKFAAALSLTYPLLADENHAVAEAYGVWIEKSMYGKKYMGISRETFVVDPSGMVAAHWPKARASEDHADEVLSWFRTIRA